MTCRRTYEYLRALFIGSAEIGVKKKYGLEQPAQNPLFIANGMVFPCTVHWTIFDHSTGIHPAKNVAYRAP
jgi:hypothetical protein